MAKIFKGNRTFWKGQEKKIPFHEGCAQEAHEVQREAKAPSGGPMEKPSRRTMTSAFGMANKVLHQAANKPHISASLYRASHSDDETTVGIDVELATPSSNPSP